MRKWSNPEINSLKEKHNQFDDLELSKHFNRTISSIRHKSSRLKLKKDYISEKTNKIRSDRLRHLAKKRIGIKRTEEIKKKISIGNLGKIRSIETRRKISLKQKGRKLSEKHKNNISLGVKRIVTPEWIKRCLNRRNKSSLELKFEDIVKQLNLPYKFVGNGEVIVARKCPDFINTNGEKIAVEVYTKRHKESIGPAKNIGINGWKQERQQIFNQHGWQLIFFDEKQINEENIKTILGGQNAY